MENFNLTLMSIRQIGPVFLLDCRINEGNISHPTDAVMVIDSGNYPIKIASVGSLAKTDETVHDEDDDDEDMITLTTFNLDYDLSEVHREIIIRNVTLN
jgi:hypothetical protein